MRYANGLPVRLVRTGGHAHDNRLGPILLDNLPQISRLLADRGYDADWIRAFVAERGGWANIPPKRNRSRLHRKFQARGPSAAGLAKCGGKARRSASLEAAPPHG